MVSGICSVPESQVEEVKHGYYLTSALTKCFLFLSLIPISIYRSQRRDCGPTFYSNLTGAVQLKLDNCNAFFLLPHTYIPWWLKWHRICLKYRRTRFNPWVRKIPWRWEWLCTPVFLPGEFHGQRSVVGDRPWDRVTHD